MKLTFYASVFAKIQKYDIVAWKRIDVGITSFTTTIFHPHLFYYIEI